MNYSHNKHINFHFCNLSSLEAVAMITILLGNDTPCCNSYYLFSKTNAKFHNLPVLICANANTYALFLFIKC